MGLSSTLAFALFSSALILRLFTPTCAQNSEQDYLAPTPTYAQNSEQDYLAATPSYEQNSEQEYLASTPTYAQNSEQDYLTPHNSARAAVGVGPMTWNITLVSYAEDYANQRSGDCSLVHSGGPYGENLFWGGSGYEWTAGDAVKLWVDESQYYDYNSNTCQTGQQCGHYTQVVWRDSVNVGCARIQCDNGAWFITCNYSPPGNYVGQWPY